MQRYTDSITNQNGTPVVGASVQVFLTGTVTPASLFSDKNGTTPIANPVTSDTLGTFWFYAADGRYDLSITGTGISTLQINDVLLEDPLDGSAAKFSALTLTSITGPLRANGLGEMTIATAGDVDYLVPAQVGNNGKALFTDGTNTYWGAVAGGGTVTSVAVSGGTTGLTTSGGPITAAGTISLAGTLIAANGGTGYTSYTSGQVLIGKADGTLAKTTLTAGSGISVTGGDGTITIASTASGGTVTSVAVSGGTTGLTTSGGPITTSGTVTLAGTLAVANGGTGGTTAALARTNLDVYNKAEVDSYAQAMAIALG